MSNKARVKQYWEQPNYVEYYLNGDETIFIN